MLPDYRIHLKGTTTNNTVCACNEDEGYFPVDPNKRYDDMDEVKCFRMNIAYTTIASGDFFFSFTFLNVSAETVLHVVDCLGCLHACFAV